MDYRASAATTAAAMKASADEAPSTDPELGSGSPGILVLLVGGGGLTDVLLLLLPPPVPAAERGIPVVATFLAAAL